MLLTKRAERIASQLPVDWGEGYPNVWMGVSIESGKYAARADALLNVPAKVRFISYEPAIGPLEGINLEGISLLIFGGESGAQRRGMDLKWAEEAHEKCRADGTAFFFKQTSALLPGTLSGTFLDHIKEMPESGFSK